VKPRVRLPIVVEGKYDKITLTSIFDCTVIELGGFGIFKSEEKRALLRAVGKDGLIVLTDSDGAGKLIRSHLSGIFPKDKLYHVYTPRVEGKEKRKPAPSREGVLGVEGMSREVLLRVLSPFTEEGERVELSNKIAITKQDFYLDGLSGGEGSSALRDRLAAEFSLPPRMTANALLSALNIVTDRDGYRHAVEKITPKG
jgi:ribonuclease M5